MCVCLCKKGRNNLTEFQRDRKREQVRVDLFVFVPTAIFAAAYDGMSRYTFERSLLRSASLWVYTLIHV